jgi:Domain of unknown function (DUF4105)
MGALGFLLRFLLLAWATLALYWSSVHWSKVPSPRLRLVLAIAFFAFGIYALWVRRSVRARLVFVGLFLAVLGSYVAIQPSFDRPWQPNVAVLPQALVDGDRVLLKNVRNFDYRTADDFTVRYESREVLLSHLTSLDFFVSYWRPGPIAHTFVSFNFDNAPPVCISIEARRQIGQGFDPLSSLFKQFGLIYVVGDERDVVRVRTNFRHEDVYLYRINASPENIRRLFLAYLNRINELAARPEFYHLLSNSCTINIVRYARQLGKLQEFDIRFWLNGYSDRGLYRAGLLDSTLPFAELRQRAWINQLAQAADDAPDFSQRIRAALSSQHGEPGAMSRFHMLGMPSMATWQHGSTAAGGARHNL